MEKKISKKNKNIFRLVIFFVIFMITNIQKNYAISLENIADGSKDITGFLIIALISVGIVLIFLAIAVLLKIKTLKKSADIIKEYIEKFGDPR